MTDTATKPTTFTPRLRAHGRSEVLLSHEADQIADQLDRDRALIAQLVSALERTEHNFKLAVAGKPVRDMSENLAENATALAAAAEHERVKP
jgi:hypothetical protein